MIFERRRRTVAAMDTPLKKTRAISLAHLAIPLGAALSLWPGLSPALGLGMGLGLALTVGNPYLALTRRSTHTLLAAAVIGLGAAMDLRVVGRVGLHGFAYTVVGIATALTLGMLLARGLRVSGHTGTLISVGTAICGGSAIAAVVPVLGAKAHETSVALGTVFLLNAVALVLFPPIGHALGMSATSFGLWCALAIHDTSSVVGAAVAYGGQAVQVATTVKLARALWIVPLTLGLARARTRRGERAQGPVKRPWFIAGFVAAAALVTFVPALRPAGLVVSGLAKQALVLTLFLIGAGLTRTSLGAVGPRPLAQGVLLWVAMAGGTLLAIRAGLVG